MLVSQIADTGMQFQSTPGPEGPSDKVGARDSAPATGFNPRPVPKDRATVAGHADDLTKGVSIHARSRRTERLLAMRAEIGVSTFQSTPGPEGPSDALPKNTSNFAYLRTVGREVCTLEGIAPPSRAAPWLYSLVFIELSDRRERIGDSMSTLPSRALDNKGALEVDARFDAVVFGLRQVVLAQEIEAQAVLVGVEQAKKVAA